MFIASSADNIEVTERSKLVGLERLLGYLA